MSRFFNKTVSTSVEEPEEPADNAHFARSIFTLNVKNHLTAITTGQMSETFQYIRALGAACQDAKNQLKNIKNTIPKNKFKSLLAEINQVEKTVYEPLKRAYGVVEKFKTTARRMNKDLDTARQNLSSEISSVEARMSQVPYSADVLQCLVRMENEMSAKLLRPTLTRKSQEMNISALPTAQKAKVQAGIASTPTLTPPSANDNIATLAPANTESSNMPLSSKSTVRSQYVTLPEAPPGNDARPLPNVSSVAPRQTAQKNSTLPTVVARAAANQPNIKAAKLLPQGKASTAPNSPLHTAASTKFTPLTDKEFTAVQQKQTSAITRRQVK